MLPFDLPHQGPVDVVVADGEPFIDPTTPKTYGQRLTAALDGRSQRWLAARLSVHHNTVWKWCADEREPDPATKVAIRQLLPAIGREPKKQKPKRCNASAL